jgi:hypothetical protein
MARFTERQGSGGSSEWILALLAMVFHFKINPEVRL